MTMNIVDAAKRARDEGTGITNKRDKGCFVIYPTDTPDCCMIVSVHNGKPSFEGRRWNPSQSDLLSDEWETQKYPRDLGNKREVSDDVKCVVDLIIESVVHGRDSFVSQYGLVGAILRSMKGNDRIAKLEARIEYLTEENQVLETVIDDLIKFYSVDEYNDKFKMGWIVEQCHTIDEMLTTFCLAHGYKTKVRENVWLEKVNTYPTTAIEDFIAREENHELIQ